MNFNHEFQQKQNTSLPSYTEQIKNKNFLSDGI